MRVGQDRMKLVCIEQIVFPEMLFQISQCKMPPLKLAIFFTINHGHASSPRFTSAIMYQGLIMHLGIAGGNVYLDFFYSSLVEFPAALILVLTTERVGRRYPWALANLMAGVACLVTAFTPEGK